jgi:pimeloyl-ACP methyl ester carboxylesterase
MSAIIVENGLLHYEAMGRGKPVLFLHGWLGSWRYWMPTMEAMSDRFRTYAFDLWGFGDSDKSPQRYELDAYVSLIGSFMDDLGLVKAPLVGHSLGAVAAVMFAARVPERVDKLVAVSMPCNGAAISRKLSGGDNLLDRTVGRKQAQQAYPDVAAEADKADANAVALSIRALSQVDLRSDLERLNQQVLLVHGEKDALVAMPEALSDTQENLRQIQLKDAQHFPMLDEATKFHRLLRDFLEGGLASVELRDEWKRRTR